MTTKENKKVKNSVFVDLFFDDETAEENDISLYNALHDEKLPKETEIQRIKVNNTILHFL